MPTDLSSPEIMWKVEVSEEHGLNEVGLLHNLNMISFVEGLNLVSQVAHDVRCVSNFFQTKMKNDRILAFLQHWKA